MKDIFAKILIFYSVIFFALTVKSQPGCPGIEAGIDQTITCYDTCTNLLSTVFATGATTSYDVSSIPYVPPFPYNSGTAIMVGEDDVWSDVINLPFNFCFFGTTYDKIVVGANGIVSFNSALAGTYCEWMFSDSCPNPNLVGGEVGPFIMGVYHDINPAYLFSLGFIYQGVLGTYPCRTFVVNYYHISMFDCTFSIATHQIVLYESTNTIEVYVENAPLCDTWNDGKKLIGIQNTAGTLGYTPPGRNTGAWSATNEAWRFTPNGTANYTVSWLQGGNEIATGDSVTVCPDVTTTYVAKAVYTPCDATPPITVLDSITVNVDHTFAAAVTPLSAT
ncbi:MAG: hypothetical protein HGB12_07970, partial [Bacteroidetes bacterium]|nr:hypothetical protein [Bacteroidota bacterium]